MTSSHWNESKEEHLDTVGDRCPAGSHIRSSVSTLTSMSGSNAAALTKTFESNEALKSFLPTDIPQNSVVEGSRHGHLTDLAYAAEKARIEARRNHKRFTDAIYARRRRLREKDDEKELVREVESSQKVNAKLRVENKDLQSLLSNAIIAVEAKGEEDKVWLQNVLAQAAAKASAIDVDETKKSPMKRKSEHMKVTSKLTDGTIDVGTKSNFSRRRTEETTTQVVDQFTTSSLSKPLNRDSEQFRDLSSTEDASHRGDGNGANCQTDEQAIENLRQASYLQGLQDAVLLNQRRDIIAAAQSYQERTEPPLQAAGSTSNPASAAAALQSILMSDPMRQHAELERLLLASRINSLSGYPDSSSTRPDLSSLLNSNNLTRSGYHAGFDLLSNNASSAALGYPNDAIALALAALQNLNNPPQSTAPPMPSPLTTAQLLAMSGATSNHQLQMQLGLINAFSDRTITLASLLQQDQQQQQLSLLAQLQLQQQQQQRSQQQLPNLSSSSPSAKPPNRNFPPPSPFS